jgi:hypothetical protein
MSREVKFRNEASTSGDFITWARCATFGDFCVYHTGNLATDRRDSNDLCKLADIVLMLQDTGFVIATQFRANVGDLTQYVATRTGEGYAPRAVMKGEISAADWRILTAVRDARHGRSITRVIRDALASSSDRAATAVLDALKSRQLVEEDTTVSGWKISHLGLSILF